MSRGAAFPLSLAHVMRQDKAQTKAILPLTRLARFSPLVCVFAHLPFSSKCRIPARELLRLSAGCISANFLPQPWILYSEFYSLAIFILRDPVRIQIPAKCEDEMFSREDRL